MNWVEIAGNVLKLILLIITAKKETDDGKHKEKVLAAKMITEGLANRDKAKVTAGWDRLRRLTILLFLLPILLIPLGCRTILHPVSGEDIIFIEKGAIISHPDGTSTHVKADGSYFSNEYIEEIIEVKIK